jgi:predicted O-methyltransferase YrrM
MRLQELQQRLVGIPHTTPERGAVLYQLIIEHRYRNCLELGFAHGVGTAYMAGAIADQGEGRVVALDRVSARTRSPRADELLASLGLTDWVELVYGELSYTWYLLDRLETQDRTFDFCFLDGSHTWETDGLAVLLVERLMTPGGMIVLDDLDWTYETSPTLARRRETLRLPERERTTPQIRKVFELLVKRNPAFTQVHERDGWGFALKR